MNYPLRAVIGSIVISWCGGGVFADGLPLQQRDAIDMLKHERSDARLLVLNEHVSRLYGILHEGGHDPLDAAQQFLDAHHETLGISRDQLRVGHRDGRTQQPLMYDRATDTYKFTAIYQRHEVDGVPVYNSHATILVRNVPEYPVVLVVNNVKPVAAFRPDLTLLPAVGAGRNLASAFVPGLEHFSDSQRIIWAEDGQVRDAFMFTGRGKDPRTGEARHEQFIFDARTNLLLNRKSLIFHDHAGGEVDGEVVGYATPGLLPDRPGNEPVLSALPSSYVTSGEGKTAISNDQGFFTMAINAIDGTQLTSTMEGPWAIVQSVTSPDLQLTSDVMPPEFVSFVHNAEPDEYTTAQVNALLHTNLVRDFVAQFNPLYPGIDDQLLVRVNIEQNCNAFFTPEPMSINFYTSAGPNGCANTAFSTVVYHEYGHYIVHLAGTMQGAYGEGMSDTLSVLVTDDPVLGRDFHSPGSGPLRNAINNAMHPCTGGIHACGRVLSGAVWNIRELLVQSRPDDYIDVLSNIVINSILLNPPGIDQGLVIDFLTLDSEGSFINGTPHYYEIMTGFEAKGFETVAFFNNWCTQPIVLGTGQHVISTEPAWTTGFAEPLCEGTGDGQIYNDRWYGHISPCEGTLRISLCGSEIPAKVGVYNFTCPDSPGQIIACGVATCDAGEVLTLDVTQFQAMRFRVGSQSPDESGQVLLTLTCVPPAPPCVGDINSDGVVDVSDLLTLLGQWGPCEGACHADLNSDGVVDVSDLLMLLGNWGSCPQ
jgi:hypothetical protein